MKHGHGIRFGTQFNGRRSGEKRREIGIIIIIIIMHHQMAAAAAAAVAVCRENHRRSTQAVSAKCVLACTTRVSLKEPIRMQDDLAQRSHRHPASSVNPILYPLLYKSSYEYIIQLHAESRSNASSSCTELPWISRTPRHAIALRSQLLSDANKMLPVMPVYSCGTKPPARYAKIHQSHIGNPSPDAVATSAESSPQSPRLGV